MFRSMNASTQRSIPTLFALLLVAGLLGACNPSDDVSMEQGSPDENPPAGIAEEAGQAEESAPAETAGPTPLPSATPDPGLPGFPYALSFDPSDTSRAYFTWRGGLLGSTDGGAVWQALPQSKAPGETEVHHVIVDGTGTIFLGGPGNFRFSDDAGETWQNVPGATEADVRGLALTEDARIRLLDGERGVLAAQPDGSWQTIGTPPGRAYGLWPIGQGRIASLDLETQSLALSTDAGETWQEQPTDYTGNLHGLAYSESGDDLLLYAATNTGLFRSEDAGETWQPTGAFPAVIGVATPPDAPNSVIVVIPGGNVYRSDDRGATWPGTPEE